MVSQTIWYRCTSNYTRTRVWGQVPESLVAAGISGPGERTKRRVTTFSQYRLLAPAATFAPGPLNTRQPAQERRPQVQPLRDHTRLGKSGYMVLCIASRSSTR